MELLYLDKIICKENSPVKNNFKESICFATPFKKGLSVELFVYMFSKSLTASVNKSF